MFRTGLAGPGPGGLTIGSPQQWHPGVAAEVGYDSNYFNRAPNRRSGESAANRRDGYPVVTGTEPGLLDGALPQIVCAC